MAERPHAIACGSSPRMRGAVEVLYIVAKIRRIIPAHAGSRPPPPPLPPWIRDHPRACGEQNIALTGAPITSGSSPRMRGAVELQPMMGKPSGIIPAHAGSSRGVPRSSRNRSDHPRACGEQPWSERDQCRDLGSSPRMRGAVKSLA